MKAVVQGRYGSPVEVLRSAEIDTPVPDDTSVLLKVHAASLNSMDWRITKGQPFVGRLLFGFGLLKPKRRVRGVDVAGRVESVGKSVTRFHVGDEVFGLGSGSFAEYVAADQAELEIKPASLTFEQAAALPIAGVTALQGLRDKLHLRDGQRILINGAGGGVGTFAVQIAKAYGAHVTAVTGPENQQTVRNLGVDEVIDYSKEDFTRRGPEYDALFDIKGDRPLHACRRVLKPGGVMLVVGGKGIGRFLKAGLAHGFLRYPIVGMIAKVTAEDLAVLRGLGEAGKLTAVVVRQVSLDEVPQAVEYLGSHRTRGKLVVRVA